jgi:hypothetical protein
MGKNASHIQKFYPAPVKKFHQALYVISRFEQLHVAQHIQSDTEIFGLPIERVNKFCPYICHIPKDTKQMPLVKSPMTTSKQNFGRGRNFIF